MTTKEQTRLQILNTVLELRWSMREATEVLGVSERHTWRLLAAYRKEGAAALAHGNRGRVQLNAIPETTRQQVVNMAQARYGGINHTNLIRLGRIGRAGGGSVVPLHCKAPLGGGRTAQPAPP